MRYDWDRYGNPGTARLLRVLARVITVLAVALGALFGWLALVTDPVLVVWPLTWAAAAVAARVMMFRMYGVRKERRVISPPRPLAELAAAGRSVAGGLAAGLAGIVTVPARYEDVASARAGVLLGPCAHTGAVPVDLFNVATGERDGERVAWLCVNPECGAQLPADWR